VSRVLGAAYYQAGKYNEAVEPLKQCIEFDPQDEVARYQLCLTYIALHDKTAASEQFEALKQNPSSPNFHLAKMLAPVMERPMEKVNEAETSELRRLIENFRRING
jgi:Tfp pilus assembly protein PilF